MMGSLLYRPIIQEKFKHKYSILTKMVDEDLDSVKKLYDHQMVLMVQASGPLLNKNMPKVAGLLRWAQELKERVHLSVDKLRALNHGLVRVTKDFRFSPLITMMMMICGQL